MPWGIGDASGHTKAADTPAKRAKWTRTANRMLEQGASDAEAIMAANRSVKGGGGSKKRGNPHGGRAY